MNTILELYENLSDVQKNLVRLAVVDLCVQMPCGVVAVILKTEKFYDFVGAPTYLLLAAVSLALGHSDMGSISLRQWFNLIAIGAWSLRLSIFLFARILRSGRDRRFKYIRGNPIMFLGAWFMQAQWIFVVGAAAYLCNLKKDDQPLVPTTCLGMALWVAGFLMEVVADSQKSTWQRNPDNHGKWIDVGLWSVCQHPNYVGEIILWFGLYLTNYSICEEQWEHILAAASPTFLTLLLRFLSGVPMLQAYAKKKWGSDPDWRKYHATTPKLLFFMKPFMSNPCTGKGGKDD